MHLRHSISVIGGGARVILVQLSFTCFAVIIARTSPFLTNELVEGFRDSCRLNVLLKWLCFRQILSLGVINVSPTALNTTVISSCCSSLSDRFFHFSFWFCLYFANFLCFSGLGRCDRIQRSFGNSWCQLCFVLTVIFSIFICLFSDSLGLWRSLSRHFFGLWIFHLIWLSFSILAYSFQRWSIGRNCRLGPSFISLCLSCGRGDDINLTLYGATFSTSLWGCGIITCCLFLNLLVLSYLLHILIKTYFPVKNALFKS